MFCFSAPFFRCASFPFSVIENLGPATVSIVSTSCILTSAITVQVQDVAGGTATSIHLELLIQSLIIIIACDLAVLVHLLSAVTGRNQIFDHFFDVHVFVTMS